MLRYLCRICRYGTPVVGYIANVLIGYLRCTQGVPGAPERVARPVFVRETGADPEWPLVRRGEFPPRYPVIEAF